MVSSCFLYVLGVFPEFFRGFSRNFPWSLCKAFSGLSWFIRAADLGLSKKVFRRELVFCGVFFQAYIFKLPPRHQSLSVEVRRSKSQGAAKTGETPIDGCGSKREVPRKRKRKQDLRTSGFLYG